MVKPNERVLGFAVNLVTQDKIPVFLKEDNEFGEVNANGIPYVDSKLGKAVIIKIMVKLND